MSGAGAKFTEFALMAWNNRQHVMAGSTQNLRTQRIYHYYYYNASLVRPDWCEFLTNVEAEFAGCANKAFNFQGSRDLLDGEIISDLAAVLNNTINHDTALLALLQKTTDALGRATHYDRETRQYRAPITLAEHLFADPAFMFDKFLWHYGPKRDGRAKYRIYVTPQSLYCPKVFTALVRYMDMPRPASFDFPSSCKLMIPGPEMNQRADKIVMYCQTRKEMEGGVDFLRSYQKRFSGLFENASPRSTQPVDGLRGVAITPQPTPEPIIMACAGQTNVDGMSFGMSRAAIIYLAMKDNIRSNDGMKFLQDCHRIARLAKIDIHLQGVNL